MHLQMPASWSPAVAGSLDAALADALAVLSTATGQVWTPVEYHRVVPQAAPPFFEVVCVPTLPALPRAAQEGR